MEGAGDIARQHVLLHRRFAAIGDMRHPKTRLVREHLPIGMARGTRREGSERERPPACPGDEILQRVSLGRGRGAEHQRCHAKLADRREVGDRVVGEAPQHHRRLHMGGDGEQHGVAVRGGARHGLGADQPARSAAVVDHDGLAKIGRHRLRHHARPDVGGAAGREGHDPADRPVRPGLRERRARQRQRTTQGQHVPAVDHGVLPVVAGSLGQNPGERERLRDSSSGAPQRSRAGG